MYHFIINPNSKSGLGRHIWEEVETILKERGISYTAFFSKYQGHVTKEVARLTSDNVPITIVVLGGDGTINEALNGLNHLSQVTLGYIPTGSSNDFARGFRMQTTPKEALECILAPQTIVPMDIGVMQYKNKKRRFGVSCGIGFDASVCHEAVVSRLKKYLNRIGLGKLTYVGIALHQLQIMKCCDTKIVLDSDQEYHFSKTIFIAVMNHRYEGGGFKFSPNAHTNDGKLDICVISDMSKKRVLTLLPTAYFGLHRFFKGVHLFTCKEVDIETQLPLAVHTDGEPVFLQRHLHVSCEPENIHVIIR